MPTCNTKRRLTMTCVISAAGEMVLPTFLDKHVNQTWAKPLAELKGEYKDAKIRTKKSNDGFVGSSKYFSMNRSGLDGTALLLLDNASCHKIDYRKFNNSTSEYLGPNMT